jgi:phosphoketolase
MKSYKAEELFDKNGRLKPELAELAPKGDRRMGANPHTNGGVLLRDLRHAGLPRSCGQGAFARCGGRPGYARAG